jgi:ribosomal protein S27AE
MEKRKMTEETEAQWRTLSEEILSGMTEWRQAHPKATLREIEAAVIEQMSRLTARLIQDLALSSSTTQWSSQSGADRPRCPHCGTILQARGLHHRHLQSTGGQDLDLVRNYGTCPTCGAGLFPPG